MRPPIARANRMTGVAAALAIAGLAIACTHEPPPTRRTGAPVRVRGFTEATAVRALHVAAPHALAVTDAGLARWDLRGGPSTRLGAAIGVPEGAIVAHDLDATRRALWLATEQAIARYDVEHDVATTVPPPPAVLGLTSFAGATLGAATDGGVWIGLPRGLYYAREDGGWTPTGVTAPVTDVLHAGDDLWVGTAVGLYVSHAGGPAVLLGRDKGCDVASVAQIVPAPEGGALVLGQSASAAQRVVLARAGGCDSYRVSPARPWQAVASRPGEVVVLADRRVYVLARPWSPVRRLARDAMRLVAVPRADGARPVPSPFVLRPLEAAVPPGARALATTGSEILVGTDHLGIARLPLRGAAPLGWLRDHELMDDARSLSVACRGADDCWIATGGTRGWRFDGKAFRATDDGERRVLAVATGAGGEIYGLLASGHTIVVAEPDGDGWKETGTIIETPGAAAELAFARVSPAGLLWVGLRYRDEEGEVRPYGVALVDVGLGLVAYHHASADRGEAQRGVLPIPIDVTEASFIGEETWLATSQGAAQIRGDEVQTFTEAEGLTSEILRGVACSAGGMVYVASGEGVGAFDGERWSYPPRLRYSVNDLALAADGRL